MENLIQQLRRPLQQHPVGAIPKLLAKQFEPFRFLTTEELLLRPARDESTHWRIAALFKRWKYYQPNPTKRNYLLLQALLTAREFLYRGVGRPLNGNQGLFGRPRGLPHQVFSRGSLRYVIYFLYAAAYVGVKPADAVAFFGLSRLQTRQLVRLLTRTLQGISFELTAEADASAHERTIVQRAAEGFEKGQLKAVYELLADIERGGRGIAVAFPASAVILLLAATDYTQFLSALRRQQTPYCLALYLVNQPFNLVVQLSQDETVRDPWLLAELLRCLFATRRRDQAAPSAVQDSVNRLLSRLWEVDPLFFRQAAEYFRHSQEVNVALGSLLAKWPATDALALVQDTLSIDQYNLAQSQRFALLQAYSQDATVEQLTEFLAGIFSVWEKYLEEFDHNEGEALFGALQTDYWDYAVNYYLFTLDEQSMLLELAAAYEQIRWLPTEWHRNTTQFIKSFYVRFTKLFALSSAYRLSPFVSLTARQLADTIGADLTFAAINLTRDEAQFAELLTNLRA